MGTTAASADPDRTAASAASTVAQGTRRASGVDADGSCSRACSVKVPSGPR